VEAVSLPKMPDAPKASHRAQTTAKARPAPPKSRADRTALDAAEAELEGIEDSRKREEAELERRQKALDAEREASQKTYLAARKNAEGVIAAALRAFRKAGGED
jgi:hypothetical protein